MLDRDKPWPSWGFASHSWQSLAKKSPVAADQGLLQQGHFTSALVVDDMVNKLNVKCNETLWWCNRVWSITNKIETKDLVSFAVHHFTWRNWSRSSAACVRVQLYQCTLDHDTLLSPQLYWTTWYLYSYSNTRVVHQYYQCHFFSTRALVPVVVERIFAILNLPQRNIDSSTTVLVV